MSKTTILREFREAVSDLRDRIDTEHRPALQRAERAFGELRQQNTALQSRVAEAETELRSVRQAAQGAKAEAADHKVEVEALAQKVTALEHELTRWRSNQARYVMEYDQRRIRLEARPTVMALLSIQELKGYIAQFVGVFDDARFEPPPKDFPWHSCEMIRVDRVGRDLMAVPFLRNDQKIIFCIWKDELAEDVECATGAVPEHAPERLFNVSDEKVLDTDESA